MHAHIYQGTDKDGEEIAVKVLQERTGGNHDSEFNKEFYSLLELRHQNIILLVGYCYETEKRINNFTKKFDEITRAALCFEYAPNGNLRNYISGIANFEYLRDKYFNYVDVPLRYTLFKLQMKTIDLIGTHDTILLRGPVKD